MNRDKSEYSAAGDDDSIDDYDERLCRYAQSCDGDFPSRTLLPLILCHGNNDNNDNQQQKYNNNSYNATLRLLLVYVLLPPFLLAYLLLLFRLITTTADSYFTPALESFSFELGLPPWFAGATLLALGNVSPDLDATVNAILLWGGTTAGGGGGRGGGGRHSEEWIMGI